MEWWHSPNHLWCENVGHRKYWHAGKVFCAWMAVQQPKTAGPSLETTTWTIKVTLAQIACSSAIYGTYNSRCTWTWVGNHQKTNNVYFQVIIRHDHDLISLATWLEDWLLSNCKTMAAKTFFKKGRQNNTNIFHKINLGDEGVRKEVENRGKEKGEGLRERGGGGWSRQQRIQQWRQRPENNMPNPGSHFLLHRRLLWNSSSVANVTTRRKDGKSSGPSPPF